MASDGTIDIHPVLFKIYRQGTIVKSVELGQRTVIVGRLLTANVQVEDLKVSRMHLLIEIAGPEQISLTDLGSTNGTYVNGTRVYSGSIKNGDKIRIGDTDVHFIVKEPVSWNPEDGSYPADIQVFVPASAQSPSQVGIPTVVTRLQPNRSGRGVVGPIDVVGRTQALEFPGGVLDEADLPAELLDALDQQVGDALDSNLADGGIGESAPMLSPPQRSTPKRAAVRAKPLGAPLPAPNSTTQLTEFDSHQQALEFAVLWGNIVLDIQHLTNPRPISFGEEVGNDYIIPTVPLERFPSTFPIIRPSRDGKEFELGLLPDMTGAIRVDGQLKTLDQIRKAKESRREQEGVYDTYRYRLPKDVRGTIFVGGIAFLFQFVSAAKKPPTGGLKRFDFKFLIFLFSAIVIILGLFGLDAGRKVEEKEDSLQVLKKMDERITRLVIRVEKPRAMKKQILALEGEGPRKRGIEGASGSRKNSDRRADRRPGAKNGKPSGGPAQSAGVVKALAGAGTRGALADIIGSNSRLAQSLAYATQGMSNRSAGLARGAGVDGAGLRGSGPSGGGSAKDIGGLGIKGPGGGVGGFGTKSLGSKVERTVVLGGEGEETSEGLDRDLIRKYIERHLRQIKSCYEAQLQGSPGLSGKIKIRWDIQPDGSVRNGSVIESSMRNAMVEGCVVRVISFIAFPKPNGGVVVKVSYPFIFKPTG